MHSARNLLKKKLTRRLKQKKTQSKMLDSSRTLKNSHSISRTRMMMRSAPIPAASELEHYELVLPGSADRILTMAEKQGDHRRELEKIAIEGDNRRANIGQWMGFVISILVIGGGIYIVVIGKTITGVGTIILALATLVGTYRFGIASRKKERIEKNKQISKQFNDDS